MVAEQFVKQEYPKAHAESYKTNGPFGTRYYLIWSDFSISKKRLGEGSTKYKAWVDAKSNLLR